MELLWSLRRKGLGVNEYTVINVLSAVSVEGKLCLGRQTLAVRQKEDTFPCGFILDDYIVCYLITTHGKCGSSDESIRVFSDVDKIIVIHLNAMLSTLVDADCHAGSVDPFRNMVDWKLEVDSITFSIILKACNAMTYLEQGRGIYSLACDSERAFSYASIDDLAAWNVMITGYAQHGGYNEAFELYDRMATARSAELYELYG
ncbi:hypothetical protein V6N11_010962 [Hibiscus sabdariffa]|uniref:Pentatricopeptide repeat-containing protein n=1 Tax=Hibiscus sabdariffa TaxID=183260 RepID=A0ABR2S6T2_9ROSI